jgi:16S rRNA processing protein RimM
MIQKKNDGTNSGSLSDSEPEFFAVGKLRRPHGIHGEILMTVWSDISEFFKPGLEVYVGGSPQAVHVKSVRKHKQGLLVAFEEVQQREEVGEFRNQTLMIRAEQLPPLDEDEYYLHQIAGMTVVDVDTGVTLGVIENFIKTGANDVYIVRSLRGSEILLPAIDEVIQKIDFDNNLIQVRLLPGLLHD